MGEESLRPEDLESHTEKKIIQAGSRALYVYLPPWHGHLRHTERLQEFLITKGGSFLTYEFPPQILSSDPDRTYDCFVRVRDMVREDISSLRDSETFDRVVIMGGSLGCVNATTVAHEQEYVTDVRLFVPGNCLAESLWEGYRTQQLRWEYERREITLQQLKECWSDLAPQNNVGFNGASVRVFLSRSDRISPYECGKKLIDAMKVSGIHPDVQTNTFLGHYGTMFGFYKFPNVFLNE